MRKPDFFIVGAPKCGTTAMNEYLKRHPEIFIPDRKEAHYFGTDLISPTYIRNFEEYMSLFSNVKGEKRVGEASVCYLYSQKAAKEIYEFNPQAQIIVMLRNPVEMIYSLYYQLLWSGDEDLDTFELALEAEKCRKSGKNLPKRFPSIPVELLFYTQTAKFTEQLRRYFSTFGRDKVYLIIYDDFKKNPAEVYKGVLQFLGANPNAKTKFDIMNSNKNINSRLLWQIMKFPPNRILNLWRRYIPSSIRGNIIRTMNNINTNYIPRPKMKLDTRKNLQNLFKSEIEELSQLLGRDLTHWHGD
ncbi:MAG: sulfotransferase [Thermodesulfobacteriota bacterium]